MSTLNNLNKLNSLNNGNALIEDAMQKQFTASVLALEAKHKEVMFEKKSMYEKEVSHIKEEMQTILKLTLNEKQNLYNVQKEHKEHQKMLMLGKIFSTEASIYLNQKLMAIKNDSTLFNQFLLNALIEASLAIEDNKLIVEIENSDLAYFNDELLNNAKNILKSNYNKEVDYSISTAPLLNEIGLIVYNRDKSIRYNNTISSILIRYKSAIEQIFSNHLKKQLGENHA